MSDKEIFNFILLNFDNDIYYDKIKFFISSSMNNDDKSNKFDSLKNIYDHTLIMLKFGHIIFKNKIYIIIILFSCSINDIKHLTSF